MFELHQLLLFNQPRKIDRPKVNGGEMFKN